MKKLIKKYFKDVDLNDQFFDSLKHDYPEFEKFWFPKCISENREAFVYEDNQGIGIFAAIKYEDEELALLNEVMPKNKRIKISTFKIAERLKGQRYGEGAIAYILWTWQQSNCDEIYLTVHSNHQDLINLFIKFGFISIGKNIRNETVLLRNNNSIDFSNPYKSFPYLSKNTKIISYLPIDDYYHDTLFPNSDLANTEQNRLEIASANGITKMYISKSYSVGFNKGDILLVYRKDNANKDKGFKSCITSYCVVDEVKVIKNNYTCCASLGDYIGYVGNKSYYDEDVLIKQYEEYKNLTVIKILYFGYFGKGNNIPYNSLKQNGLWPDGYPTTIRLNMNQFVSILRYAKIDPLRVIK